MNSPLLRRLASGILAILILTYVGYQVYNARFSKIQTETAAYATVSNTIQANGIAVRRESVLTGQSGGVIDYVIPNGGKVSKGGKVAQIYADSQSAMNQRKLQSLDAEIARLRNLSAPGDTYAASPDTINSQINRKLGDILGSANAGDYTDVAGGREDFLYLLNERQMVTEKTPDFSARINTLQAQRDALAKSDTQPTGSVTAPAPGYFINTADGFETVFDIGTVLNLTASELKTELGAQPAPPQNAVGKICSDFNWYFAFILPENQLAQIRLGSTVSIQFPFASSEAVPATVAAVNKSASEAAVILESNYMNSSIASIRKETAQIRTDEYTGIRVSQKAVHFETVSKTTKDKNGKSTTVKKNVEGVYVMEGNQVLFRQIVPLYSTENYVVCDVNPSEDDLMTASTVQLSDEVVVEGSDLYNGKVVE
jgi:hypothetical protein